MDPRESSHMPMGFSRRQFLHQAGGGIGTLALEWLLHQEKARGASLTDGPLTPRLPHFPPRAESVIYLFMHGGPSHLETFDPKPDLQRLAGQPLPASFGAVATRRKVAHNPLLADVSERFASAARAESRSPISCRTLPSAPTTWR